MGQTALVVGLVDRARLDHQPQGQLAFRKSVSANEIAEAVVELASHHLWRQLQPRRQVRLLGRRGDSQHEHQRRQ